MSTIIYNRNGGIEINPDPFLKIQFIKINTIRKDKIRGYGYSSNSISIPSTRYKNSSIITDLPDFNELVDFMNNSSQIEIESFQYNIANDTAPYSSNRVNGIYLHFNVIQKGKLINREDDILEFLGISKDLIKKANNLCDYFHSSEIIIGRDYDIYFLRRIHTSMNIVSGWLFNGKPEDKIFTSVSTDSVSWIDDLDEILEGIYFDLSEIRSSKESGKVLIPIILNTKGISITSGGLDFCISTINNDIDKYKITNFLKSEVEKKLEDRIPINLSEIYIKYIMTTSSKEDIINPREDFYNPF